jgi:hypothetical protein
MQGLVIKMVICLKCGAENEENNIFCLNCGKKLRSENNSCSNCGIDNPQNAKFCVGCGKKLNNDRSPELNIKNFQAKQFSPNGTLDDFKNDMDILSKFAQETTKMINSKSILLTKDENLETNLNSNLKEIKNKINNQKKELDSKLKVLSSDIIFINFSKDENDPQLIKFDININEAELNKYVEFYKNHNR